MAFANTPYAPETVAILGLAFDAAWNELTRVAAPPGNAKAVRVELARGILQGAARGDANSKRSGHSSWPGFQCQVASFNDGSV